MRARKRRSLSQSLNAALRRMLPLSVRLRIAFWMNRNRWLYRMSKRADGLFRDLRESNPKLYHKLLWEQHFDKYGRWYHSHDLFTVRRLNGTREAYDAFAEDLREIIDLLALKESRAIRSVLDVGSSMGCLLRHLETRELPYAGQLLGVDIDRVATLRGNEYLRQHQSRIELKCGDMEQLEEVVGSQIFDMSIAAGSLSYLNGPAAERVVGTMLARTRKVVVFFGLANYRMPNDTLTESQFDPNRGSMWVHNFGGMVWKFGWEVALMRWLPPSARNPQGLYCVFAVPAMSDDMAPKTEPPTHAVKALGPGNQRAKPVRRSA